jgi:acyl phosphate:glycerol-3-phosphate acyltransferase
VDWGGVAWVAGGYGAGTLPSTWIVAGVAHASRVRAETDRRAGEADPHILSTRYAGWRWSALASTMDVLKGLLVVLAAREIGDLSDGWLAAVAVAAVLGHVFPPYLTRWAGRGLATSAGVLLVLLPVEMVIAGALFLAGVRLHASGLFSSIGFASVPAVAAIRGQPAEFVIMSAAIFAILVVRRLEGVGDVVRSGIPLSRAILYRAVFDTSSRPKRPGLRKPGTAGAPGG